MSKIYQEKHSLKKIPKAYLQKVLADSRKPAISDTQGIINTSF